MLQLRLYVYVVCVCGLLLSAGAKAHAQKQSLGLTPALVDANVRRGLTYTQNFTVVNNTTTRLRFHCMSKPELINPK